MLEVRPGTCGSAFPRVPFDQPTPYCWRSAMRSMRSSRPATKVSRRASSMFVSKLVNYLTSSSSSHKCSGNVSANSRQFLRHDFPDRYSLPFVTSEANSPLGLHVPRPQIRVISQRFRPVQFGIGAVWLVELGNVRNSAFPPLAQLTPSHSCPQRR